MNEKYYSKKQCIANVLKIRARDVKNEEIRYYELEDGTTQLLYKGAYIGIYDKKEGKLIKRARIENAKREKVLW